MEDSLQQSLGHYEYLVMPFGVTNAVLSMTFLETGSTSLSSSTLMTFWSFHATYLNTSSTSD